MWGRCRRVCPPHIFIHLPTSLHTFPHFPPTSTLTPYTLPHLPHFFPTSPTPTPYPNTLLYSSTTLPTSSIFFPYLTQLLKLPKIPQFPHHPYCPKFSILPRSPRFFLMLPHTYFIINPIPNFFTLLIYCQI